MSIESDPQLVNGLTQAEHMQLSLDYMAAPEAFTQARIFHAVYIEDITDFRAQLDDVVTQEAAHNKLQADFRQLESQMQTTIPDNKLTGPASGGAFGVVESGRRSLARLKERAFGYGEEISRAFAAHMQGWVPGVTGASLNGTRYEWNEGFVITRGGSFKGPKTLNVYGNTTLFTSLARRYLSPNSQATNKKDEVHPHIIEAEDWLHFLNDLLALTRF